MQNVECRKTILVVVLFLVIGFFTPNHVLAFATCGVGDTSCTVEVDNNLVITAVAQDEDGFPLVFTNVAFVWEITKPTAPASPTDLGIFTNANGVTCSGTNVLPNFSVINFAKTTCTETINNATGSSSVNLHGSSKITLSGEIKATATYAGISKSKIFTASSLCLRTPKLYYGIASVADSGENNWQKSTAEILETCLPEYKLNDGMGWGIQ